MAKRAKEGKGYRGVKVKLDPTPAQERAFTSHAGAARFAYNWALDRLKSQIEAKDRVDRSMEAMRKAFNEAKASVAPWYASNSKEAYNTGFERLATAYKNYEESRSGKRKGRKVGFPRFKCKGRDKMSFAYTTGSFGVADAHGVKCPRIGRVHALENVGKRVGGGHVTRMTITKEADGWCASLCVETDPVAAAPKAKVRCAGVDIGTRKALVTSDGKVYPNPRNLDAALAKLRKLDQKMARQRRLNEEFWKSKRYRKAKEARARAYARVKRLREAFWTDVVAGLLKRYSHVYIEDVNVAGLLTGTDARGRVRRRNMSDMGFGMFRRMLEERAGRRGVTAHAIDRFYGSSKTCSACGAYKHDLGSAETYVCDSCGCIVDRDFNAAINILERGLAECPPDVKRRGGDVRHAVGNGVQAPHLAA